MPRQRSRSPLSPILATESATVRLFFILSVLLCSVNNAGLKTETWLLYCLRLRSRSPHNAKHSTSSIRKGVKSPTSGDAPTDQIPALIPTRLWWGEVGHIIDRCIIRVVQYKNCDNSDLLFVNFVAVMTLPCTTKISLKISLL